MPRPKKEGAEPKRRSRHGCWPCKGRKIKCGEEKPQCMNCVKQGEQCDYSIRLNWDGRKRKAESSGAAPWSVAPMSFDGPPDSSPRGSSVQSVSSPKPPSRQPNPTAPNNAAHAAHLQNASLTSSGVSLGSPYTSNLPPTPAQSDDYGMSPAAGSSRVPAYESGTSQPQDIKVASPPNKRRRANNSNPTGIDNAVASSLLSATSPGSSFPPTPSPETYKLMHVQGHKVEVVRDGQGRGLTLRSLLSPEGDNDDDLPLLGFDQGRPDIDIPRNDDSSALQAFSPSSTLRQLNVSMLDSQSARPTEFGFGMLSREQQEHKGDYYNEPVPVKIPRSLQPLPDTIRDNPMNLLYFHHFINHTAKILVPHDCDQNPFRSILPQMAIQSHNLMSLLLAYSASHRARYLNHVEPTTRIAQWTKDVFPNLRAALACNDVSDATLAAAIMLASLEIISPGSWGVSISWKAHLGLAREMIIARGGYRLADRSNRVSSFLGRWFAYLDVLGSLSGSNYDRPLYNPSLSGDFDVDEADTEIDCVLGFTSRCVVILASIADLAKRCDALRIRPDGTIDADWKPPADIQAAAESLKTSLERARLAAPHACHHHAVNSDELPSGAELVAVNDAYHWAGLIHIYCRVLNKESDDPEIQAAVDEVIKTLYKVAPGSSAEACLVFPIFTAGCEARNPARRQDLLERMKRVEHSGMSQVGRARTLMEKVWSSGKAWETLVSDEFVG